VDGACSKHGRGEKSVQGFGRKSRRKKTTLRPCRKWEDGIKMDLLRLAGGGGMWSGFTWWALVNAALNLRVLAPRS
jgi:hypothetical protein